jgi:SAM-dependent methyltransferase
MVSISEHGATQLRTPNPDDPSDVEATIQRVRLELHRENVGGALELVEAADRAHPDARYRAEAVQIRSFLAHLSDRDAYIAAQEGQYHGQRGRFGLKYLERRFRMLTGRKTRKLVERRARHPEFQLLEREILSVRPRSVVDGGAGEGGVALAVAARHPSIRVDAVEASITNVRIASGLNRYPNATFRHGLIEELPHHFAAGSVDLVYSFAVLEHVRDVDQTIEAVLTVLRPGGRFCFVVPMKEFEANGHIPPYVPRPGYCDHVRVFTERELRDRFGRSEGFVLHALDGPLKPEKTPPFLRVLAHGSFFAAFSKANA